MKRLALAVCVLGVLLFIGWSTITLEQFWKLGETSNINTGVTSWAGGRKRRRENVEEEMNTKWYAWATGREHRTTNGYRKTCWHRCNSDKTFSLEWLTFFVSHMSQFEEFCILGCALSNSYAYSSHYYIVPPKHTSISDLDLQVVIHAFINAAVIARPFHVLCVENCRYINKAYFC